MMQKFLVAAALVVVVSLVGYSMVSARGNHGHDHGPGMGYGYGDGCGYCDNWSYDGHDKEKVDTFLKETQETRKQLAVKRSERRALMSQDNPDEKKVGKLTGEIFDLKNLLDEKAKGAFGDNPPFRYKGSRGGFGNCDRGPRNF
jgi:Spy/CpxP family protein refolding chaperone